MLVFVDKSKGRRPCTFGYLNCNSLGFEHFLRLDGSFYISPKNIFGKTFVGGRSLSARERFEESMFCWDRRCVTQGCLALSRKYISIGFGEMSIPRSGDRRWKEYQRVALDSWKRRSKGTGGYATRTGSKKPLSLDRISQ